MKYLKSIIIITLLFSITLNAENFSKKSTKETVLTQKGNSKHWCNICGMKLKNFYKTSHYSIAKNKEKKQFCSLRCFAVNEKINKSFSHKVIDAKSQNVINAKSAFYVINSKVPGTMSKISKLAFENKKDALGFIKTFKGELASYDIAFKLANSSLKKENIKRKIKMEKKIFPMGKKMYEKMCNAKATIPLFKKINKLKEYLLEKNICKNLKEKQLHIISLYLMNKKSKLMFLEIKKTDKCPICGMFIHKHKNWASQILYTKNKELQHISFDGSKDLIKFLKNKSLWSKHNFKSENIKNILFKDYYSSEVITAKNVYFVEGSDVYGPMGKEYIPFVSKNAAEVFLKDHKAKRIISFADLIK